MSQINLLPSDYKPQKNFRLSIVLVVVALFCTVSYFSWQALLVKTEIEALQNRLYILENSVADLRYLEEKQASIKKLQSSLDALKNDYQKGKPPESSIIAIMESLLPREVYIDGITISPDGVVSCGVTADSYETVAQLIIKLNSYSIIEDVTMSGISKSIPQTEQGLSVTAEQVDYLSNFDDLLALETWHETEFSDSVKVSFSLSFRVVWNRSEEVGDAQ